MSRALIFAALAIAAAGCLHSRTVDSEEPAKEDSAATPTKDKVAAKAKSAPAPQPKPEFEAGRPQLSPSPTGIMTEDGVLRVQDALVKRGYLETRNKNGVLDGATSAALRKFQGDEEVAKTGAPDRETVRKLGLSIDDVFRTAGNRAP